MNFTKAIRALFTGSCLAIMLASGVDAQRIRVNFDYSTFHYDSTRTYVEVYYAFDRGALHYVGKDSSYSGLVVFKLEIEPATVDSIAFIQYWKVPVNVRDTSADQLGRSLVGQISTALAPGNYRLILNAIDLNDTTSADSLKGNLQVPKYSASKLEASGIELSSTISSDNADTNGVFYKNTYDVIPNPIGIFGAGMPIVYYYFEAYNISEKPGDSTFTVQYQIRDSFGAVHRTYSRTRKKFGPSSVEVGTINTSDLKTGTYTLVFNVKDSLQNAYATSSKRFFVYNPNLGAPETPSADLAGSAILSSAFGAMTEEQIDKEFAEARYASTSADIEQFRQLHGLDAKRQFLYEFWKKRNQNPVSGGNDYRSEYLKRVAYANDHFKAGNRDGWESDRGRVYILYGNPDEIDRHPNENESRAYEIWSYNSLQGGVTFDFIDRTGFGDYALVNSTARNEIRDDNWQQYLTPGR